MGIKPSGSYFKPIYLAWILVNITLSLILKSGLYSDDIMTYQMRRSMPDLSLQKMAGIARQGMTECIQMGRFIPLAYILEGLLMWLSSTILIYKVLVFGINLLAVFSFTRLLGSFEMDDWIPLALLTFCASAQFYVKYHDPFTSLHAMFPLLGFFVFSSISSFVRYLKTGKPSMLLWSLLALILAILDSEVGFILYPILFVLLVSDDKRLSRKIAIFLPYAIVLICYSITFFWIRQNVHVLYTGVEANMEPSKMLRGFIFQLIAAFPLTGYSYISFIPGVLYGEFLKTYPVVILSIAVFICLLIWATKLPFQRLQVTKQTNIFWTGLILLVLPACIIMVSKKYQGELEFGRGYLPVYIQDFGFVLLVLLLFDFLFSRFQSRKKTIVNIGFSLVFLISLLTFMRNYYLIEQVNTTRSIPSMFYYKSLKNGILKDCEYGSVIVLRTDYFWHAPFYYQEVIDNFYRKGFKVIAESDFKGIRPDEKGHYYMLEHNSDGQYTLLYRILPDETKPVNRINYPTGKDFSYFDLISRPL